MAKPRIYWRYYPKCRRGFWCVSIMPKPHNRHSALWNKIYSVVLVMNVRIELETEYRRSYAQQLELRKTT